MAYFVYNILVSLRQGLRSFADPIYLLALGLGLGAWLFPHPRMHLAWPKLLYLAFFEELIFRFGLQQTLQRHLTHKIICPGLSLANILTSAVFALLHLNEHPPLWAILVFFPSLLFGWAWDRYKNIVPCWGLHFVYNYLFFFRP